MLELYYYPREVWWCALGVNIGSEEDGTGINFDRPVLILKKLSPDTCLVVPLTTSKHEHKLRPLVGSVDGKIARALLTQVRVVDTKRLLRKIDTINKDTFSEIRKKVRAIL
jgi:mRNA interferase MazF